MSTFRATQFTDFTDTVDRYATGVAGVELTGGAVIS